VNHELRSLCFFVFQELENRDYAVAQELESIVPKVGVCLVLAILMDMQFSKVTRAAWVEVLDNSRPTLQKGLHIVLAEASSRCVSPLVAL